ncbi:MAG: MFS transporter, partial [Psychrilyobacter sp.]|uniref:MFS transporter n=1 Tax=Psychrilyobacter sp. TaxID=2586924 RepID=UPI003C78459D
MFSRFVFYGPIATLYRQANGLSMSDIFIIESFFGLCIIIFEVPWGWIADKVGYKWIFVISNALLFISKIIFYEADSFNLFLLERVLLALALSGISGCDIAILHNSTDKSESEKVFGRYSAFSTFGYIMATFMSGYFLKKSMEMAAFATIIPYGIAVVLAFFIIDDNCVIEEKIKIKDSLKLLLKDKRMIIFLLSVTFIREIIQSVMVFLSQLQYTKSNIEIVYFGIIAGGLQIMGLISAKGYKISEKIGHIKSIRLIYISLSLTCILLALTSNPVFTIFLMAIVSLSRGLLEPMVMTIQNNSIKTNNRAV